MKLSQTNEKPRIQDLQQETRQRDKNIGHPPGKVLVAIFALN